MVDVQVALSLQSNQENEKRETDFVIVQTPFSKSIISDNLSDIFFECEINYLFKSLVRGSNQK